LVEIQLPLERLQSLPFICILGPYSVFCGVRGFGYTSTTGISPAMTCSSLSLCPEKVLDIPGMDTTYHLNLENFNADQDIHTCFRFSIIYISTKCHVKGITSMAVQWDRSSSLSHYSILSKMKVISLAES
jgi:hypothetical protein